MTSASRATVGAAITLALSAIFVAPASAAPEMPCIVPILTSNLTSASPGAAVSLQGSEFRDGEVVQLKWNLQGQSSPDAPVLATATGPIFSVGVTVPPAAVDGAYWIVAVTESDRSFNTAMDFYVGEPPVAEEGAPTAPVEADPGALNEPASKPQPELRDTQVEPQNSGGSASAPASAVPATDAPGRVKPAVVTSPVAESPSIPARSRAVVRGQERSVDEAAPTPVMAWGHEPPPTAAVEPSEPAIGLLLPQPGPAGADAGGGPVNTALASGVGLLSVALVLMMAGFLLADMLRGQRSRFPVEREQDISL